MTTADESFHQAQQAVAALAGGGFAAVWVAGRFPERDVFVQWVDRLGRPALGPGGRGLATQPGDEGEAVIVAHPTAGAYVAFIRSNSVVVQYLDAGGEVRWETEAVDRAPDETTTEPHLIANPSGGVFVCLGFNRSGPRIDIRCQRLDSKGARLWPDGGVSMGDGGNAEIRVLPRGVPDGEGGILVFCRNQRDYFGSVPPGPILMEGQRFAADGTKLWGALPRVVRTTRLASSNGWGQRIYQVVSDGQGGAVLAFDDWTGTSDLALDVMAQRVSSSGDLLWGEGAVVTGANGHQQHEQTIPAGDGGAFIVAYEDEGPTSSRLLMFRLAPGGTHAWPTSGLLLSDSGAPALDYGVHGSFDEGVLRLGWTHQNYPATFDMDVQYATYTPAGAKTGGAYLTTAPDAQFLEGLAYSPTLGAVFAAWDDRRKGTWDDLDTYGAVLQDTPVPPTGRYYPVTPCRLLDTRERGLPLLRAEVFSVIGACCIPASARALAVNATVVSPSGDGHLTLSPALASPATPTTSTVNFAAGSTRANNAIVPLSFGAFQAVPTVVGLPGQAGMHLVLDVSGYFD